MENREEAGARLGGRWRGIGGNPTGEAQRRKETQRTRTGPTETGSGLGATCTRREKRETETERQAGEIEVGKHGRKSEPESLKQSRLESWRSRESEGCARDPGLGGRRGGGRDAEN